MNYAHHIIQNFPKKYPWWRKILTNIIFFFGGMVIHERKNLLNNWDLLRATYCLKKGDVVLVGQLQKISSIFIGGPLTHTLLYIGHRRFIHSMADGVEYTDLHEIFCQNDTIAILREKKISKSKIQKIIEYAKEEIGKPYDFEFEIDKNKFYCSELVACVYIRSGSDCGIKIQSRKNNSKIIKPVDFINEKFKIIMLSHNLKQKNPVLELIN